MQRQVEGAVAAVPDQGQLLELLVGHRFRAGEIAHVDEVRLQQLLQRLVRLVVDHAGSDDPRFDLGEAVRNEPLAAHLDVDFAQARLPLVKSQKRYLGLNGDGLLELFTAVAEDGQFHALDIHLQEVEVDDLIDGVEAAQSEGARGRPPCHYF